ncbi:MAG: hypothetical protein F6K35_18615 [Okeania sp. SIO2H7]|nr:hypothetical protein [Okeania sp. SIO2H7]
MKNLRSGRINVNNKEYIVICATAAQQKCDRQNMLFTFKPENAKNPNKVLRQMLNYTRRIDAKTNFQRYLPAEPSNSVSTCF